MREKPHKCLGEEYSWKVEGHGEKEEACVSNEAIWQEESECSVVDMNLERWPGAGSIRPYGSWKNCF